MATATLPPIQRLKQPDRGTVGILCLILAESALFAIFVVAYLFYIGKSLNGPYPKDLLEYPIFASICLLSSSLTIVVAERALKNHKMGTFKLWWAITIVLGLIFLAETAKEWYVFIHDKHFTISTNLFGTTFYTLVGLHASHVIVGLIFLIMVLGVTFAGFPIASQERRVKFLSWYWHFVDAVWIVVFTVVYVIGR
jgi:cytochrome c oxidase subunit III